MNHREHWLENNSDIHRWSKSFRIHGWSKDNAVYKTKKVYASDDRDVFFSDPPHLVKTTHNCLSHSSRTNGS